MSATSWPATTAQQIADTDDFHIAPYRPDGVTTGTLTWIWSVVVDGRVFVRAWNGTRGKWYQAAVAQRAGKITAAGAEHDVAFAPVDDADLGNRIDAAFEAKYAGSPYLPPMTAPDPRAATIEVAPRDRADGN
ncbi:DUF2255 family protein [Curtobacterium pusillum]|uniref:DUF2255 family protein n=1 Tax=Curtobacterium pusillum TaxID=69373 RepID=A0ABX2MC67_9MICO|nr:DUF2255 family protein [Curtobacterium pusillum]NUU15103.1 DUF2255 family protein [Curtobacterium pusillum]GLK31570.1 hypothetical protein GCM10017610_18550 [Curtobacterium pusillum]